MWSVSDVDVEPGLSVQPHCAFDLERDAPGGGPLAGQESAYHRVGNPDCVCKVGRRPAEFHESFPELDPSRVPTSLTHSKSIAERQHHVKRQQVRPLALWQDVDVKTKKLTAVGERLLEAMKRAGLSQADLAKRADVDPSALTHLKYGTRKQQAATTIAKIERALGVSSGWLQSGVGTSKFPGPQDPLVQAFATYVFPKGMKLDVIGEIKGKIRFELEGVEEELPVETIHRRIADIIEEM